VVVVVAQKMVAGGDLVLGQDMERLELMGLLVEHMLVQLVEEAVVGQAMVMVGDQVQVLGLAMGSLWHLGLLAGNMLVEVERVGAVAEGGMEDLVIVWGLVLEIVKGRNTNLMMEGILGKRWWQRWGWWDKQRIRVWCRVWLGLW
jgi:hypothetical protein